jgi:hypothetical protein
LKVFEHRLTDEEADQGAYNQRNESLRKTIPQLVEVVEQAHMALGVEFFRRGTTAQWNPDARNRHTQAAKTTHLFLLLGFRGTPRP